MYALEMSPAFPLYNEDYARHYGGLQYAGKRVLDIGASHGDAAWWFLGRGARGVIAVESDPHLFAQLAQNTVGDTRVLPIHATITTAAELRELIMTYTPDIIKLDCEGCESTVLGLPDAIIRRVPAWVIELHPWKLPPLAASSIASRLEEVGYRVHHEWKGYLPDLITGTRMLYAYH